MSSSTSPKKYDPKAKPNKTQKKSNASTFRRIPWNFIFLSLVCLVAISYLTTQTFFFGYKIHHRKWIQRLFHKERIFTPEELKLYDGTDPEKPIYLAVLGKVYDVTAGRSYYGPGGGYHFFAGRDAGRAFATGCFETHLTPDVRGLSKEEKQSIEQWQHFYETSSNYFYIGQVIHPPLDPTAPIPPPCQSAQSQSQSQSHANTNAMDPTSSSSSSKGKSGNSSSGEESKKKAGAQS